MRVGIFGGSFNPVHNGHLRLAFCAMSELNLRKVIFVPSHITPLKNGEELLPWRLRVLLLRSVLKGRPGFELSLCEIRRKGLSYTVDTLKFFKKKLGRDAVLFFLAGADTAATLKRWKSWDEVTRLCRFVMMARPGFPRRRLPKGVYTMPLDALPVSSTEVRRRLDQGKTIRGLVPPEVGRILAAYRKKERKKLS